MTCQLWRANKVLSTKSTSRNISYKKIRKMPKDTCKKTTYSIICKCERLKSPHFLSRKDSLNVDTARWKMLCTPWKNWGGSLCTKGSGQSGCCMLRCKALEGGGHLCNTNIVRGCGSRPVVQHLPSMHVFDPKHHKRQGARNGRIWIHIEKYWRNIYLMFYFFI
jgi:hypothetical protein